MDDHILLKFWLFPSPDEFWKTDSYQSELQQFERDIASGRLAMVPARRALKTFQERIDDELRCEELLSRGINVFGYLSFPLSGEFIVTIVKTLGSLGLGGMIGAWIQARHGRKVRVKIGDIEAEASTTEEVEKLLAKALQIQLQKEPKKIQES